MDAVLQSLENKAKQITALREQLDKAYARIAALEEASRKVDVRLEHVESFLEEGNPHV